MHCDPAADDPTIEIETDMRLKRLLDLFPLGVINQPHRDFITFDPVVYRRRWEGFIIR